MGLRCVFQRLLDAAELILLPPVPSNQPGNAWNAGCEVLHLFRSRSPAVCLADEHSVFALSFSSFPCLSLGPVPELTRRMFFSFPFFFGLFVVVVVSFDVTHTYACLPPSPPSPPTTHRHIHPLSHTHTDKPYDSMMYLV